jgi:transcriptional regulator with XRE-family HTH domain
MGNNLRDLRLAFLLTPRELAERMGTDVQQIARLEAEGRELSEEWVEAVARALGVPKSAVVDPAADIRAIVMRAGRASGRPVKTCPIGARFAIQAMVAKLGGLKMALGLDEDALATAVQNLISYVEAEDADGTEEARLNRLSLSLRIIVLTILQSRALAPDPQFPDAMERALAGATSLLEAYSGADGP